MVSQRELDEVWQLFYVENQSSLSPIFEMVLRFDSLQPQDPRGCFCAEMCVVWAMRQVVVGHEFPAVSSALVQLTSVGRCHS